MYPITNAVKALFDAEQRQVLRITGTDRNGTAITITETNVMEGGFNIDRYSCNSSRLEIGTAIAAEMTLKLDNRQGQFDNIIFEGAELFVEVGIADWTQNNPTVTYVPCGYFTPDEQPRRLSTISLNALDRMTRFDQAQPAMVPWTDNHGNKITDNKSNIIYFAAALEFPLTIAQIVQYLCNICDVPLGTDLTTMPGYDYIITELPDLSGEMTARNIIQWSAGIMASNAWIDWSGKLRFSWFNNTTGYTTTTANRFDSDMYENDVVITGVQWVDSDDERTVYLSGTNDYVLDLSDNALIDSTIAADVINDVYNVVHGFAYRPFKATVVPAPYLWPMDRVTFTDKNGSGHVSIITNVNFTINGSSVIAANGETSQTNSMAQPSGFTAEQLQLLRKIRRTNATDLNNAIDNATSIITGADGGFIRFIYDDEDNLSEIIILDTNDIATATKVWRWNSGGLGYSENGYAGPYNLAMTQNGAIVADFITAGTMSANVMRAGILTDITGTNFWDLDNGVFRLAGNTTLDGRPITQLLTDIDATISSVEIQFAQNQSQTVAPTDRWSTEAPSWASGYYIWQRTVTTSPSGVTYSDPTCISGRDGSESTPGLNQATVYLYQRSETAPAAPDINTVYTFVNGTLAPLPDGWTRSIPTGTEPCWSVSASAISTDTTDVIAPDDWSTPVMMFENGENGSSVDSVVDYYAISSTTTPPADTEFWTPGVPVLWMDNFGNVMTAGSSGNIEFMPPAVPVPTLIDPYVWQYQLTTYTDGTTSKSNKHLTAILGDSGVGITDLTVEYYLSASNTEQIFGEWTTEQPQWMRGYYIWTRTVITWTDGKTTTTEPVLAQSINLANETADNAVNIANKAIDNTSNLDASLNQTGVFNRLTNNGAVRGIFMENNQLYMNADYIKSGTIDAGLIAAGSLTINQLDGNAKSAIVTGVTVKTQYYLSSSASEATGGTWTDAVPAWSTGKYAWTRDVTTKNYADGTSVTTNGNAVYDRNLTTALSTSASASSAASSAATTAAAAQSKANSAVVSTVSVYYRSTTNTTPGISSSTAIGTAVDTSDTWTYVLPRPKNGCYFFTCERYTYGDSSIGYSPVRSIANANYTSLWCSANDATYIDGAHIYAGSVTADQIAAGTLTVATLSETAQKALASNSASKMQYYLSNSSASATGGTWQDTVPTTWTTGKYVWTRVATTVTKADGTTSTSYSAGVYNWNATQALSTSASASSAASSAAYREQIIYISKASATPAQTAVTTWVTNTSGNQNVWTTTRPVYSANYPVLFTAVQRQTMAQSSGYTCSCTAPVVDQTTTVIDGGHITTGVIDAGVVNVTNINADNITSGTIDGTQVNAKLLNIVDAENNVLASYSDVITIGENTNMHAQFDFNSFELYDKQGNTFLSMGDARGSDGLANVSELFIGDGTTRAFIVYNNVQLVVSVTINGTATSSYTRNGRTFTFTTAPSNGSQIVITYNTNSAVYHYDLGIRSGAIGNWSVVEGNSATASGYCSHAEGNYTTASGYCSHAEGNYATASGYYSHAEGSYNTASGWCNHAEGDHTTASGMFSHAEGSYTSALEAWSHAEGEGTIAASQGQHVSGRYNVADYNHTYIEIVGNGGTSVPHNVRTLDWYGNEWIAGKLTQASDARLKTESGEVPDLSAIPARRFKWNDNKVNHDDKEHLGYFAQDVEAVAPYLVDEDAMGYKSLDYIGVLVAKIASLEKRVAELENASKTTR